VQIRIVGGAAEVPAEAWDALEHGRSPFSAHAFLKALEDSGSVGARTGWQPLFLVAERDGLLVGAAPAYVKSHSYGEYIFDWAWAEGAQRAGVPYYPKLVLMPPFTPATGRRVLLAPGEVEAEAALMSAARAAAAQSGLSGVHWLFTTPEEQAALEAVGYHRRVSVQYHWRNDEGWADFEAFLGALNSKRRREIRRERKKVREQDVDVAMLSGREMTDLHWAGIRRFYYDTGRRKWGQPYLTPAFFDRIRATFGDSVRFAAATQGGELLAGALNFHRPGSDAMYGRYWGCDERVPQLHFETCYYAAIEHCLEHGLTLYEAGAQGEHKIARGFLPVPILSAHWLADPRLDRGVEDFLTGEREHTEATIAILRERKSPFR
jgi:predicted N-acyltransferase